MGKYANCIVCDESIAHKKWSPVTCDDPRCRYIKKNLQHEKLPAWLANQTSADQPRGRHGVTVALYARCYILVENNWKCSSCSWGEIHPSTGLPPLEIDHIDGNTGNNFRSNLRLLCPNCHALTPTFRRMNAKNRAAMGVQGQNTVVQ